MTDWIEHTGNTCPVDPETVVEVRSRATFRTETTKAGVFGPRWLLGGKSSITHYRIVTPAKPPEPEERFAPWDSWPKRSSEVLPSEPDLVALRLECMKLAAREGQHLGFEDRSATVQELADSFLDYVLNGSVDKAKE